MGVIKKQKKKQKQKQKQNKTKTVSFYVRFSDSTIV